MLENPNCCLAHGLPSLIRYPVFVCSLDTVCVLYLVFDIYRRSSCSSVKLMPLACWRFRSDCCLSACCLVLLLPFSITFGTCRQGNCGHSLDHQDKLLLIHKVVIMKPLLIGSCSQQLSPAIDLLSTAHVIPSYTRRSELLENYDRRSMSSSWLFFSTRC